MSAATVAFPLIGHPIPPLKTGPERFLDEVTHRVPHWIYHIRITKHARGPSRSPFSVFPAEDVDTLARCLGLRASFALKPREFIAGVSRGECSEYAFGYPLSFSGRSADLALAVGMVAAANKRPLPPWILCSGALERPFRAGLRLGPTSRTEEKVLLSFGQPPDHCLQPLVKRLYVHPGTPYHLGPHSQRVLPGRVRLFLLSAQADIHPLQFSAPLEVHALKASLEDFGQHDFQALRQAIGRLVRNDVMLAYVPSLGQALRLLGYPHSSLPTEEEPIRFYQVRYRTTLSVSTGKGITPADVQQELAALEYRLSRARGHDFYTQMMEILEHCMRLLQCESGDISIADPNQEVLCIIARRCRQFDGLPHWIARYPDGTTASDLLNVREPLVVFRNTRPVPDQRPLSPGAPLAGPLESQRLKRYQEFLDTIHATVCVPLARGRTVVGLLNLYCHQERRPNPTLIRLVQALAERAAEMVSEFLAEAESVCRMIRARVPTPSLAQPRSQPR